MIWLILGCVLAVGMIVIIVLQWRYITHFRNRQQSLEEKLRSLENEKHVLDEVLLLYPEDEHAQGLIKHRGSLIDRMLVAGVTGDQERSLAILDEVDRLVSDRAEFMRQIRLLYESWHPGMMARLHECGLTDEELEICCLYALGLNGKTIQQYTGDSRHYQHVGLIRKKLGLGEHDKNINGYINSLKTK